MIPVEGTVHSFDFGGQTLAEYYGVGAGENIEQLAFVFRKRQREHCRQDF